MIVVISNHVVYHCVTLETYLVWRNFAALVHRVWSGLVASPRGANPPAVMSVCFQLNRLKKTNQSTQ